MGGERILRQLPPFQKEAFECQFIDLSLKMDQCYQLQIFDLKDRFFEIEFSKFGNTEIDSTLAIARSSLMVFGFGTSSLNFGSSYLMGLKSLVTTFCTCLTHLHHNLAKTYKFMILVNCNLFIVV